MTYTAKVRATPAGEVEVHGGPLDGSVYDAVEIAWYPDHLEVTALGAGRVEITAGRMDDEDEDVIVELRPPPLEQLDESVPGAD